MGDSGEKFTYATSALLTLEPGTWYYRVRGINFSLPGTARAMSWSAPVGLRVAKPTFAVVKKSGVSSAPKRPLQGLARAVPLRGCPCARVVGEPRPRFALSLADDADAITLARFRAADLRVETKPDLTPVSEADRAAEAALRARLARERPGEAVLGEEEGGEDASGWILDPIDGTRNYTRGIPVWATLIAYADRVAVVSAPALGRRWWAERGAGAFLDGEPDPRLRDRPARGRDGALRARAAAAGAGVRGVARPRLRRLLGAHARRRGRGRGRVDASGLAIWDWAPMKILVEEAGGRYEESVSWNGRLDVSELR